MKRIFIPALTVILSCFIVNFSLAQGPISNAAKEKLRKTDDYLQQLAQNPNVNARRIGSRAPEQDCINGIPICQQNISQSTSYSGFGNILDIDPNNTCLSTGETNSVWYIFTVQNSGTFGFDLNTNFDYDFALWNITNTGCNLGGIEPIRCNYSANNGTTGLWTFPTTSGYLSFGAGWPAMMPGLDVQAGETYALLVNNFTGDNSGYTLEFDGSASIVDNTPPQISSVVEDCNIGRFTIEMDEPIDCGSLANANATVSGPAGVTVTSIQGIGCASGSFTTQIEILYTQSNPTDGEYTLTLEQVEDYCGNTMTSDNINFTILNAPDPVANPSLKCIGSNSPVTLSIPTLSPGVTATWSNGDQGNQTTVNPNATTTYSVTVELDGCSRTNNVTVPVVSEPPVNITPSNPFVCGSVPVTLTANTNAVGATFNWSSGQSTQSISVTPSVTTVYSVTVSVGTCEGVDSVTVVSGGPSPEPICANIYVTPNGSGSGTTKADPTDIRTALGLAQCNNSVIKMAAGTYPIDSAITNLTSYTTIEGGFDASSNWEKSSLAGATTILRTNNNPSGPATAPRLVAFLLNGQSFFRFQDLTIEVEDADTTSQFGVSTYGLHLSNCSNYDIVRCQIIAGNASKGADGQSGTDGVSGDPGADGDEEDGGTGACGVTGCGGNGGDGGDAIGCGFLGLTACPGDDGQNGQNGGGNGGDGGGNSALCQQIGVVSGSSSRPGQPGADGIDGTDGNNGTNGNVVGGFFEPGGLGSTGFDGTNGLPGGGGGGAGGALTVGFSGGGGGGGGAGGEGGIGGEPGYGGGGAFGVVVFNNGSNSNFLQTNIQSGQAGAGGDGGPGGQGGTGGAGGDGATGGGIFLCDNSPNGDGGDGGDGGAGGEGGDGQPGINQNFLLISGDNPTTLDSTFDLQNQPILVVEDVSCADTDIQFQTAPQQGATWDFGLGATNTNATSPQAVTQYDTISRKDVAYGTEFYAGFVNIAVSTADVAPNISTSAPFVNGNYRICAGDTVDFFNSTSGIDYIWDLGGGATPNVYQGDSLITLNDIVFETPDTFWISLQVESDCCGLSDPDSLLLVVDSLPVADIQPDTLSPLCEGQAVTLTASGGVSYEWNTGDFTATITDTPAVGLNPYVVQVTSATGCRNISDTVFVEVNPGPQIDVVGNNQICSGDTAELYITGFPGATVTWWSEDGDTLVTDTLYVSPDSATTYFAQAENLNCNSNVDSITVYPDVLPMAQIVGDTLACIGDTVTVEAFGGKDYVWNNGDSLAIQTFVLNNDTTLTVIPISSLGCVGDIISYDITAQQFREVEVSLAVDENPLCPEEEFDFTATPTFGGTDPQYAWLVNGDTVRFDADSSFTYSTAEDGDSVEVVLYSNETCVTGSPASSNAIEVQYFDLPVVQLQEIDSTYIIYDDPVPLVGVPEGGAYDGTGVSDNAFVPEDAGVGGPYVLSYSFTDENGCSNADSIVTLVVEVPELYGIPNAFTPNSGDANSTFSIVNSGAVVLKQAQIFNRWGELVHNEATPWDGEYNGKIQPAGTYVYYFVIELPSGEEVKETGEFSLIR